METNELPSKLLEVACRIRFGELSHKDNELVDQSAHALKAALDEIALLRAFALDVAYNAFTQHQDYWAGKALQLLGKHAPLAKPNTTIGEEAKWTIEYDNGTGPGGEGFSEWWTVSDEARSFKCGSKEGAKWLRNLLNSDAGTTPRMLPVVGADENGCATLEWWNGTRKLTLYTVASPFESLLMSWGPNIETEMEYVSLLDAQPVREAFQWLMADTRVTEDRTPPEPQL